MSEKARVIGTAGGALGLGAFAAAIGACCGQYGCSSSSIPSALAACVGLLT